MLKKFKPTPDNLAAAKKLAATVMQVNELCKELQGRIRDIYKAGHTDAADALDTKFDKASETMLYPTSVTKFLGYAYESLMSKAQFGNATAGHAATVLNKHIWGDDSDYYDMSPGQAQKEFDRIAAACWKAVQNNDKFVVTVLPSLMLAADKVIAGFEKKKAEADGAVGPIGKTVKADTNLIVKNAIEAAKLIKSNKVLRKTMDKIAWSGDSVEFMSKGHYGQHFKFLVKALGEVAANMLCRSYANPVHLGELYSRKVDYTVSDYAMGGKGAKKALLDLSKARESLTDRELLMSTLQALAIESPKLDAKASAAAAAVIDKKAEAPPEAPLQQIAFGAERIDDVPFEPDTKEEKRLYNAIHDHVNNNKMIKDEDVAIIQSMMKKGYYPNMFKEPEGLNIYRGMSVSEAYLRKALKLKKGEKLPATGKLDVAFRFTPWKDKAASSWTTKLAEAWDFSQNGYTGYRVVMYAVPDENPGKFLDLRKGLYNVKGMQGYEDEKEAIGMGPIRVYRIDWKKIGY